MTPYVGAIWSKKPRRTRLYALALLQYGTTKSTLIDYLMILKIFNWQKIFVKPIQVSKVRLEPKGLALQCYETMII